MYSSQSCICSLDKIAFDFEERFFFLNEGVETAA